LHVSVGAELVAVELGCVEPGRVELGATELGAFELGAAELGAAELGAAELGAAELGAAELGAAKLGAADGAAELGPADGAAELDAAWTELPPTAGTELRLILFGSFAPNATVTRAARRKAFIVTSGYCGQRSLMQRSRIVCALYNAPKSLLAFELETGKLNVGPLALSRSTNR
jgi:hypothetical protein